MQKFKDFIKKSIFYLLITSLIIGIYIAILLNPHSLFPFIAFIGNLSIGIFVYLKDRKSLINKTFALMSSSIAILSLDILGLYLATNETFALYWMRLFRIGMIFIPPTLLHFILAFTKDRSQSRENILYLAYGIAVIFTILNWTGQFKDELIRSAWKYSPKSGKLYTLLLLDIVVLGLYSLYLLFHRYKKTRSFHERIQIQYVFLAVVAGIFIGLTNTLLSFGIKVYPFGSLGYVTSLSILSYAILRHRLMGIEIIIRRGVIYITLTILITIIYGIIVGSLHWLFGIRLAPAESLLVTVLAAIVIAMSFLPLREKVQVIVDKLFFKERLDYQRLLHELIEEVSSITSLDRLLSIIVDRVTETMHVEKSSIFLADDKERFYLHTAKGLEKEGITFNKDDYLIQELYKYKDVFIKDNIESKLQEGINEYESTKKKLEGLDICIPLFARNKLIGIFNLSNKQSGDTFNDDEIELLLTIGNHVAMAIENIKLIEAQLKMKEDLMVADKLAAIGITAQAMAHDLKNPLTSISNYVQIIPHQFNEPEFWFKFNKIVPDEINRMNKMLISFLNSAKLPEPEFSVVDVRHIIDNVVLLLEDRGRGVEIIKDYQPELPQIMADEDQLKQVFMNIILNSFQAMPMGGKLEITVKEKDGFVMIEFKDTGYGIPEEYLKDRKLFKPFVTTKDKGAGLGLAICEWIIKTHHDGKIDVESEFGKGATFTIYLPLHLPEINIQK